MNSERLGKFVREKRKEAGETQNAYSQRLGISVPSLYELEAGKGKPTKDRLLRMAEAMNVDPRKLFEEAEETFPMVEPPPRAVKIPYELSDQDLDQVQLYAFFLHYRKDFQKFLEFNKKYEGRVPTREEFRKSVDQAFDIFFPVNDKGGTKEQVS